MTYQITTDLNTVKRDIAYNILRVIFEKNNFYPDSQDLAINAKTLAQNMFNIDLNDPSHNLKTKLLSTLLYDDDNKEKINSIYKEVAEDVAKKLNLIFVVNPDVSQNKKLWGPERKNYFIFSDLTVGEIENNQSKTTVIDTMPKIETVNVSGVPHTVLRKNYFVTTLENSDVTIIRDIDSVEKDVAIALISSMQTKTGFTATFRTILALPLKEDSELKNYMGRDMVFASETKSLNLENNNQHIVSTLPNKIKDLREQNFNLSDDPTNTNKII